MRIDKSQASEDVNEIDCSIETVIEHAVNILRPVKAISEVVVNVQQRVQYYLKRNKCDHYNAEQRRLFLEWVVVFVNEPLCACLKRDHYYNQNQKKACVDLCIDLLCFNILLTPTKLLAVVLHLYFTLVTIYQNPIFAIIYQTS